MDVIVFVGSEIKAVYLHIKNQVNLTVLTGFAVVSRRHGKGLVVNHDRFISPVAVFVCQLIAVLVSFRFIQPENGAVETQFHMIGAILVNEYLRRYRVAKRFNADFRVIFYRSR